LAQGQKYLSLQAGRGIAALLVVVVHSAALVGNIPELWHSSGLFERFSGCAYGVQFFFVLSGVVILTAHWKDISRASAIGTFLWKRFRRIYPLYWIFFSISAIHREFAPNSGPSYERDGWVLTSSVFLFHIFSTRPSLDVAWTLFHEILFYIFFGTVILNRKVGGILLLLWFCTSFFFFVPNESYWFNIFSANHLLFAFGMIVAWLLRKDRIPFARTLFVTGCLIFAICIASKGYIYHATLGVSVAAGVGAALTLLGAAELERQKLLVVPVWLAFLGDASYSIYLGHSMVVSTLAHIFYHYWGKLPVPPAIWMIPLFIGGSGAGILVHLYIERPLLAWLGRFGRNRKQVQVAQS